MPVSKLLHFFNLLQMPSFDGFPSAWTLGVHEPRVRVQDKWAVLLVLKSRKVTMKYRVDYGSFK